MIRGTTQLLGVMGDPVSHSLSPVMHNAALAELGADYVYVPFAVGTENLATALEGFAAIGVQGFNITIPHKQRILPWLQTVSVEAQAVGAVNTVWRTATGWAGTNTDVVGFLAPLKTQDRDWRSAVAVVLGNGGAARAVVAGCAQMGLAAVQVVGRSSTQREQFWASWQGSPLNPPLSVQGWDQLPNLLPGADLVVNTTPLGMHPQGDRSPLSPDLIDRLPQTAIAYDLIYTPRPTQFLALAAARGLTAIDGSEMLVQQGAAALEIWLRQPVPVDTMRQALLNYLDTH